MYNFLKSSLKKLLPKSWIFKNELLFRKVYASFRYRGAKENCNVCENHFSEFIQLEKGDALCPFCGSLDRNRALYYLLIEENRLKGKVLHFSPSRTLYRKLKNNNNLEYITTDFEDEFIADFKYDITKIPVEDQVFDTIICFHVLEHIIEDKKAMQELFRVLKTDGSVYIQTPFKEGEIYEDYSITSSKERLKHFGQEDHVRIYSIDGLQKRLEKVGFNVRVERSNFNNLDSLKKEEVILICSKI